VVTEPGLNTSITTDNRQFDASMKRSEAALDGIESGLRRTGAAADNSGTRMSRLSRTLDAQSREARTLTQQFTRLENETLDIGNALSRTAQRVTASSRAFRLMRGQMYNASVQLQDFAVQVGAGTSAMTAFSQNAPQFLSFFGPKAAAIGALIAALPLLKAGLEAIIGPAFDAQKAMEDLEKATTAYKEALDNANRSISELYQQFGNAGPFMGKFYDDLSELASIDLENRLSRINDELTALFKMRGGGDRRAMIGDFFDLNIFFGKGRKEARALASAVLNAQRQLEAAGDNTEAQLAAQMALFKAMSAAARARDGITEAEQEILDLMQAQVTMTARKFALENQGSEAAAKAAADRAQNLADQERQLGEQLQAALREQSLARYQQEQKAIEERQRLEEEAAAKEQSYIEMRAAQFTATQQRIRAENGKAMQDRIDDAAKAEAAIEEERLDRAKAAADAERALGEQLQAAMRQQSLETYRAEQRAIEETEAYILEMEKVFNAAQQRMRDEEIAATEASLDRLFRARTVMYTIRFAGEASVMDQPVAPSGGRMNPGKTREELLAMGVPEGNLENFILKPSPSGGGRGGGGGATAVDPFIAKMEQLRESLMTEEELERQSYERRTQLLEEFLQRQPEKLKEYQDLQERLQAEHQQRMAEIDVYRYGTGLQQAETFFGDMATALRGGNEQMMKIAQAFGAAEALINAWRGYAQVIGDPTVPWFAKVAKAAAVLSAGLGAVQAIKGASPGGTSSGGGGAAAVGGAAAAPIPTQTVAINLQGDTFSRATVEGLLEQIQSQLDRGGRLVFQ
jgi:hypothetical protein